MTTSFNSIVKQLQINRFYLPCDVLNEIKSFCFYDIKSWEIMNFIKDKKNIIHNLFNNFTISRANPYDLYLEGQENTNEQWVFWVYNEDLGSNPNMHGYNCKCCGNYKLTTTHNCPDKIMCYCADNDEGDFDDLPPLITVNTNEENFNNWFYMIG
jgi:hypothetical protein